MVNIREFHTDVYNYLNELRQKDTSLRYTYRKSNYGGRLDEGLWFYGNDDYFAISFWTGMDWRNRTPNICFVFTSRGESKLEISVTDSDKKKQFVEEFMKEPLGLSFDGRRYFKVYGFEEYAGIEFLKLFLEGFNGQPGDKEKIDQIIKERSSRFFRKDDNGIDFIDPYEFRSRDLKISKYIELQDQERREEVEQFQKPHRLKSFQIKGYQDIIETSVIDISNTTRWIFFTGENGSGKTSLLKVIALTLGYKLLSKTELKNNSAFKVAATFHKGKTGEYLYERSLNENCSPRFPLVAAMSIFGPNRLISNRDSTNKKSLTNYLKKEGLFDSLWKYEYRMLDIEDQFTRWSKEKKGGKDELEKRKYYIRTLLSRIVPGLYNIKFKEKEGGKTKYIIRKDESSPEEEKDWQQLPSGTRSVFAMVSEMMVRLNHYQKNIIDPSELIGVVIIDEIDLHLHPSAQRKLIIDLSEAFRNIQFIVATHSPIPLLGAPEGSVFIRVTRDPVEGVCMERLTDIEQNIGNMLPNILYTSSVFGMHDLVSIANKSKKDVLTQESLEEAEEFIRLKRKFGVQNDNDLDKTENDEKG